MVVDDKKQFNKAISNINSKIKIFEQNKQILGERLLFYKLIRKAIIREEEIRINDNRWKYE